MQNNQLCYLTIIEAAAALRKNDVSPVDLTEATLKRIQAIDSNLHAFITVTADLALQQARQAKQELSAGKDRGPLHGIPIALKDLYMTKGIRTTCHSAVLENWVPDYDATTVTKLKEAGAILLGKLGMHEFAFGGPSVDAPFPAVRNPWNTEHVTGGSSSGCGAALAAGLCFGALGSDTGGSIRTPALLLQAIAGFDAKDPASAMVAVPDFLCGLKDGIANLRIGVPRAAWFDENLGVDEETETVFNQALEVLKSLGATIIDIDGRPFSLARKANQTILVCEAYAYHEKTLQETPMKFGSSVRRRMLEGAFLSAADYLTAQRARSMLNERIRANFSQVDIFAAPSAPRPPEAFSTMDPNEQNLRPSFTNPFNLTGLPAISVPCGFTQGNLPVGLQIAAKPFEESTVLRVAHSYEQATNWHAGMKTPRVPASASRCNPTSTRKNLHRGT